MRNGVALLVLAMMVVGTPSTAAAEMDEASCAGAFPPCGWINPQLYLDIPETESCSLFMVRSSNPDLSGCPGPPTSNAPITMEGEFRMTWDVSEEGLYANDPDDPIEVTFRATSTNPAFVAFDVEPNTYVVDSTILYNPENYVTKDNGQGGDAIWFEYIQPVKLTFTRVGEPTEEDLERIINKDGLVQVFIRIHSDPSGSTYRDSYGMEVFNFHAINADAEDAALQQINDYMGRGVPAPSPVIALAALGVALAFIRRR